MAYDKGCQISSALQTKQGSRGQVKQSRGFELAQTTGVAQSGRPGSPLILESPLMAFPALSTEGQTTAWWPSPPALTEHTSNRGLRRKKLKLREMRKMLVPSHKQDLGTKDTRP